MKLILLFMLLITFNLGFTQSGNAGYKIVNVERDNRGLVNYLDVYTPNMSVIRALNKKLFDKYKNTGIVTFQIYYYDNQIIASKYKKAVFDKSISDDKLNKMAQHVIGSFVYNAYLNPKETLNIVRDPDNNP